MHKIFIDGQAGTTGLQISERLAAHADIQVLRAGPDTRKDPVARGAELLASADVAILCLPDDAARESVDLAAGKTRILDASSAHRTDAAWQYDYPNSRPKVVRRSPLLSTSVTPAATPRDLSCWCARSSRRAC